MKKLTLRGNEVGIFDAKVLKMFKDNDWTITQWKARKEAK